MESFRSGRLVFSGLLIWFLVWAVLIALVSPLAVNANGRVLILERQSAGPYEIAAGTIPSTPVVGAFHMTMNVLDASNEIPIIDAKVLVTAVGPTDPEDPDSEPIHLGPLEALNSPTDLTFYDINTVVEREGSWVFTITVDADLGEGSADFPFEVVTPSPITGIVTFLTILVFVTIIALSVRAYLRERSRRRQSV